MSSLSHNHPVPPAPLTSEGGVPSPLFVSMCNSVCSLAAYACAINYGLVAYARLNTIMAAEQYNGGVEFHSDTDEPIDHGGSGDEADGGGGGKEEEEKLDPERVMEQLLYFLDELEAVENGDSDEELAEVEMKYRHLPWRGRCWNVSRNNYVVAQGNRVGAAYMGANLNFTSAQYNAFYARKSLLGG